MWCLGISIASPERKDPFSSSEVFFFETEKEAMIKLKACKISFIKNNFNPGEDERVDTLTVDSPVSLIEELFEIVNDQERFYENPPMRQEPFSWEILEVQAGGEMTF